MQNPVKSLVNSWGASSGYEFCRLTPPEARWIAKHGVDFDFRKRFVLSGDSLNGYAFEPPLSSLTRQGAGTRIPFLPRKKMKMKNTDASATKTIAYQTMTSPGSHVQSLQRERIRQARPKDHSALHQVEQ